jgi:NADH-quinone oxidoreductase subunit F
VSRRHLLPESPIGRVDDYLAAGGGRGLEQALRIGEVATIEAITAAGLRGRGGAGFPTGRKWSSVRGTGSGLRFVVVNAAEGEPATFKDRMLIRMDPYSVIEGAAIAAFAVGAGTVYVATKRSYRREVEALTRAAVELGGTGMLQELGVNIVEGPDDYLYGEEKAMLEVIEGRDPLPRLLPPYELGLFASDVTIGWEAGSRPVSSHAESNPTSVTTPRRLHRSRTSWRTAWSGSRRWARLAPQERSSPPSSAMSFAPACTKSRWVRRCRLCSINAVGRSTAGSSRQRSPASPTRCCAPSTSTRR